MSILHIFAKKKKCISWNFKNALVPLCGRSQCAQSNAVKGNAVQWGEAKRTGWQNRMNFALKVLVPTPKIIRPHCSPQSNAINFKGNAVQCWIDLWCSEVKRTGWQKKGRVLLLKIMPLFCYFRRITIGSSPFWEWSKSQQALADLLRPILPKNGPKIVFALI